MTVSQENVWAFQRNNLSVPKLILKNPEITFVVIGGENFQTRNHAQIFTAKITKYSPEISLHWRFLGNLSSLLLILPLITRWDFLFCLPWPLVCNPKPFHTPEKLGDGLYFSVHSLERWTTHLKHPPQASPAKLAAVTFIFSLYWWFLVRGNISERSNTGLIFPTIYSKTISVIHWMFQQNRIIKP